MISLILAFIVATTGTGSHSFEGQLPFISALNFCLGIVNPF
jgi:hypothetical protein